MDIGDLCSDEIIQLQNGS